MKYREKKMEVLAQFCEKLGYKAKRVVINNQVFWDIIYEEGIQLNLTEMESTEGIHAFFSHIGGFCPAGTIVSEISAVKLGKGDEPECVVVYLNDKKHDGISIIEAHWASTKSAVTDEEVMAFNRAMKEGDEE